MSTKSVLIKGFQRTSLIDYPGNVVSTVFMAGCNMRCGFCHNPELALDDPSIKPISEETVIKAIKAHRQFIDGVCITGGEPLLQDIESFLARFKELNLKIKVDTNGTFPQKLSCLIEEKLIDYVAMDVKLPLDRYHMLGNIDAAKLNESISILKDSSIDYEFRTTVVPSLLNQDDLIAIAQVLRGGQRYVLQQFVPSEKVLDIAFSSVKSYLPQELEMFAKICSDFIPTRVRL